MDLNHRSPGYEPDGISRLPHLVNQTADLPRFETTDGRRWGQNSVFEREDHISLIGVDFMKENLM